jgi:hypothetical protein
MIFSYDPFYTTEDPIPEMCPRFDTLALTIIAEPVIRSDFEGLEKGLSAFRGIVSKARGSLHDLLQSGIFFKKHRYKVSHDPTGVVFAEFFQYPWFGEIHTCCTIHFADNVKRVPLPFLGTGEYGIKALPVLNQILTKEK